MPNPVIFFTKVGAPEEETGARLLIESLRAFGGALAGNPVWVFAARPAELPCGVLTGPGVQVVPLDVPETLRGYPFGSLVLACQRAEELARGGDAALAWLDSNCLVLRPPLLFDLTDGFDAAVRPVHLRNLGLPPGAPPDAFWAGVYRAVGVPDVTLTVTSSVDRQETCAYFNSHAFSLRASLGLFGRWRGLFERLVADEAFQATACADELHRIYLFQALFSTLVAASLSPEHIRVLPEAYNYPYHLHARIDPARRARALNDLTLCCFEGLPPHPDAMADIDIREPLRSWLLEQLARG